MVEEVHEMIGINEDPKTCPCCGAGYDDQVYQGQGVANGEMICYMRCSCCQCESEYYVYYRYIGIKQLVRKS